MRERKHNKGALVPGTSSHLRPRSDRRVLLGDAVVQLPLVTDVFLRHGTQDGKEMEEAKTDWNTAVSAEP